MAVPHYYSGEYSKALNQLRSALVLLEKHDYTRWTINCYVLLGIIHFAQGEMDLAEEHLTNGIVKALETKQTKSLAILYNNLASVYLQREAYEKARTQYHESLKFISPDDELSFAQTNMNIGLVHLRMGEYKQAKKYLLENRSFFEETSHLRSKITWRNILGELYLATEDWDNVIALSIQTLKELEQMPLAMAKQSTLNQLSLGYEGLDDHQQALKYFKAHVALKDSLFSEEKTKEIERLEAQLEFDQKEREIGALTQENLQQEVTLTEERNMRNVILFSGGVLLLMIAVAWMIYKRQQDKRRHMLALKKIEIEQRMLRSQMNPHFIFNALNSIQSFVTTKKTYEAEMIMSKFSMLVRKILENSTQKMISVEEATSCAPCSAY
jgi:tetratricopeptide (TPR) repeat protein